MNEETVIDIDQEKSLFIKSSEIQNPFSSTETWICGTGTPAKQFLSPGFQAFPRSATVERIENQDGLGALSSGIFLPLDLGNIMLRKPN